MDDSARLWRVQESRRDTVDLMVTDRRAAHRRFQVPKCKLTVVQSEHSCYRVFRPGEQVTTIRASGEPPGRGGPLIWDDSGVWSVFINDRGSLNDFSEAEMRAMDAAGMTSDEKASMIGNCAPRLLVEQALEAITIVMMPFCPNLQPLLPHPDDESTEVDSEGEGAAAEDHGSPPLPQPRSNSAGKGSGDRGAAAEAPEMPQPPRERQRLAIIPTILASHSVALDLNMQPRWLRASDLRTGHILAAARSGLAADLEGEILVPAGSWSPDGGATETFVVAHLMRGLNPGSELMTYRLGDISDRNVYPLASLALAKVCSHASGHTSIEHIAPMLDSSGAFKVGALAAKLLAPPRVAAGSAQGSRWHMHLVKARGSGALHSDRD